MLNHAELHETQVENSPFKISCEDPLTDDSKKLTYGQIAMLFVVNAQQGEKQLKCTEADLADKFYKNFADITNEFALNTFKSFVMTHVV